MSNGTPTQEGGNMVTTVITAAVQLLKLIGIRSATQHLSYAAVQPVANKFSGEMLSVMLNAYGEAGCVRIASFVPSHFVATMKNFWGLDAAQNKTLRDDIQTVRSGSEWLARELWLFAIWVGTNIDQNRPETFQQFMRDLFREIFETSIVDAGLDPAKADSALQTGGVIPQTPEPKPFVQNPPPSQFPTLAGQSNMLLIVLLIGAAVFLIPQLLKKGKAA